MSKNIEIWKPMYGKLGGSYEISNFGRVRSIDRSIIAKNGKTMYFKGKLLTPRTNGKEYYLFVDVSYYDKAGKRHKTSAYIHKEMALVFLKKPAKEIIRVKELANGYRRKSKHTYRYVEHINGDVQDNRLSNLRWITQLDLYKKQVALGRKEVMNLYQKSKHWQKRTQFPELIPKIETFIKEFSTDYGYRPKYRTIAEEFGISTSTAHKYCINFNL